MKILETRVEPDGPGRIVVITRIELEESAETADEIGEGPTGEAVPDRIVRALIDNLPLSLSLGEIQQAVGGNPGTVNRQAWTLANNASDLQLRLRGWVMHVERGRYALTPEAKRRLGID